MYVSADQRDRYADCQVPVTRGRCWRGQGARSGEAWALPIERIDRFMSLATGWRFTMNFPPEIDGEQS